MLRPTTLAEARGLAERMAQSPADAVSLAGMLAECVQNLPPEKSELLSRYEFERATLWTMVASFENVDPSNIAAPDVNVIMEHDSWVRGVCGVAIPRFDQFGTGATIADLLATIQVLDAACFRYGRNGLPFFEANFKLDDRQGFVSSGSSELLTPATLICGDGVTMAPMDWRLQKDQAIQVQIRNRLDLLSPLPPTQDQPFDIRTLRWVLVCFWTEELRQPSAR